MVTEKINKEIENTQSKREELFRDIEKFESDLEQLNAEYEKLAAGLEFDKAEKVDEQIKTLETKLETKRDFIERLDFKENEKIKNAMIESYNDYLAFRKKKQKEGQSHIDKTNKNIDELFKSMDTLEELNKENVAAITNIHKVLTQLGWNGSSPINPYNVVPHNARLFTFKGHKGINDVYKNYQKGGSIPELVLTKGREN